MVVLECPRTDVCDYKTADVDITGAVALLVIHGTVHPQAQAQAPAAAPTSPQIPKIKVDSPKIATGTSAEDWESFKRLWKLYKSSQGIQDAQRSTYLMYCCEMDLQTDILKTFPNTDISAVSEKDLLEAIENLAVKRESVLVQRIKISKLVQSPGVYIRNFYAQLHGQAKLCKYTMTAKCGGCDADINIDYSDEMIKDHLVRGISDQEILSDLLGDPKTDRTAREVVDFVANKEQAKLERGVVGDQANAVSSGNKSLSDRKCWACGETVHAENNNAKARKELCKAWSSECNKCNKQGHYNKCCSKCSNCGLWGHRNKGHRSCTHHGKKTPDDHKQDQGFVADQLAELCATNVVRHGKKKLQVSHHIFDKKHGWVQTASKPHPSIMCTAKINLKDHSDFGTPIIECKRLKPLYSPMITDSGCQSTIMPVKTAYSMGLTKLDLIPVRMKMTGAGSDDLGIVGAVILDIATEDGRGNKLLTKQFTYVAERVNRIFLSRQALEDLKIVNEDFPRPMTETSGANATEDRVSETVPCDCPKRTPDPPRLPTELPDGFKGTDDEVNQLKDWLLNHYASSAFNICDHQALPKMTGAPMRLYMDTEVHPTAVHKSASVPVHWRDQVKAELERDVRLGVLERVPENTPTTWLSRMVVTAKSNG